MNRLPPKNATFSLSFFRIFKNTSFQVSRRVTGVGSFWKFFGMAGFHRGNDWRVENGCISNRIVTFQKQTFSTPLKPWIHGKKGKREANSERWIQDVEPASYC